MPILDKVKRLITDPALTWLYVLVIIVLVAFIFSLALECEGAPRPKAEVEDVKKAIRWWGRNAPLNPALKPKRLEPLAQAIAENSEQYQLPWSLVTAIVLRESSGHAVEAKAKNSQGGEIGEMQVHPSNVRRFKCDMSTVDGRIDCGCKVLRHNVDKCGSLRGGLTRYASKYRICSPRPKTRLAWVVRDRIELARRFASL